MKIAIIHDWLTGMRGGEKCLEIFCELFPQADLFTLLYNKGTVSPAISRMPIKTSFIQKLPFSSRNYRNYLPLFPRAIESFDLSEYDFILSSSHCVAKGAKKPEKAFHLCYCYTPMRYAWMFFEQYFGFYPEWKRKIIAHFIENLKKWDLATLNKVDKFIAISETIKKRIERIYKRDSTTIYPPVDVEKFIFDPNVKKGNFYVCVTSLVPYKRVDIIVEAFNILQDKTLIIVGDGPLRKKLEEQRKSKNIKFTGWLTEKDLISIYQKAKGFIYAAEEDFGIATVEAQAAGLPVIAYGEGGATETVIDVNGELNNRYPTGWLFREQNSKYLIEAINGFEKKEHEFSPEHIRANALKFSRQDFKNNIKRMVEEEMGNVKYVN